MAKHAQTPAPHALPVAPYLGGKRNLAKRLCELISDTPHSLYAEPFVGMGGVFFRRSTRPKAEVINDYGRDVANLFRILQRHYPQFIEVLRFQLTTRTEFERLTETPPDTLTDLERAARFLYLQRTAFGGKPSGQTFGVSPDRPARFNLSRLEPMLEDAHTRLAGVVIECLDFREFIARYDQPGTLFYLDPPYYGCEKDYGADLFKREDFAALADQLRSISGRFILSINDHPEIREVFAGFDMEAVQVAYTVARRTSRQAGELIITGGKGS